MLFEAEGYHPPMITEMLKYEGIFESRRRVAKFYHDIRNLLVCSCWALSSKTREKNYLRDIRACVNSLVPENGNGKIKRKRECVVPFIIRSITVQYPFAAR